jgi:ribulose-phosphate 3-epimerase
MTTAYFDAHLMISMSRCAMLGPIVKAGAQSMTFHVEAVTDPAATAKELRKIGCHVGITLRPATPVETILPALDLVDIVSGDERGSRVFRAKIHAGSARPKAREIKKRLRTDQRLEMDGGLNAATVGSARDAGVDWFVVASAIFDHPDRRAAIEEIREQVTHG